MVAAADVRAMRFMPAATGATQESNKIMEAWRDVKELGAVGYPTLGCRDRPQARGNKHYTTTTPVRVS